MANINISNISTSLLKQDIINNGIKELYKTSTIYNSLISSNNPNVKSLLEQIDNDIDSLNNSLVKFDLYLNNYINDYLNINAYLANDSHNSINSIPTQNLLRNIETINNLKLESFNVPNYNLSVDYEIEFDNQSNKGE